jgi:hypothetical protein
MTVAVGKTRRWIPRGGEELGRGGNAGPEGERQATPVEPLESRPNDEHHPGERETYDPKQGWGQSRALDEGAGQHDEYREGVEHHHRDGDRDEGDGREIADADQGGGEAKQPHEPALAVRHRERAAEQGGCDADERQHQQHPVDHDGRAADPREGGQTRIADIEAIEGGGDQREDEAGRSKSGHEGPRLRR